MVTLTPNSKPTVFVVDNEQDVCRALTFLIESEGLNVETRRTAYEFLARYDAAPGCLILDVRLPGMSGIELQRRLTLDQILIPVIFLTGYGDVSTAVQAMKAGAFDFIEKPFCDQDMLASIQRAVEYDILTRGSRVSRQQFVARLNRLTPREREVLDCVAAGNPNKEIAYQLDIKPKTVEAHRANIMRKTQADGVAELVRMIHVLETDLHEPN